MFLSVTRLKLRSWRFLPGFALHALRSRSQAITSPGLIAGKFATEPGFVFWTITLWTDEQSMKSFRNSAAHLKAMPRLAHWCDEASYVHWEQEDLTMPNATIIFERLRDTGKLSHVKYPSGEHAGGAKTGKTEPKLAGAFGPAK
jgi:hypothetical protein